MYQNNRRAVARLKAFAAAAIAIINDTLINASNLRRLAVEIFPTALNVKLSEQTW